MPEREQYRLWQRSNGIWYVVTGAGAKTRSISTHSKHLRDAEIYRAQLIAEKNNAPPPVGFLISDILDRYQKEHAEKTRSPETIGYHLKPLKAFFGDLLPQHITNRSLYDYAVYRRKQGKKRGSQKIGHSVSNGTILREIGTLKAVMHFAAGNRWIAPMPPLIAPVPHPPPRDRWLSRMEARKVIDAAQSPHVRLFIQLALATAARSGAILDLTWGQIDFDRCLIDFGRGYGNKRRAIVPINNDLLMALRVNFEVRTTEFVIEWCGKPVKSVKSAFRKLVRACSVDASPHTLRHTAATWLVMDGVPLAEVARLLGDNEQTVERVYGKHAPDYLRRAVDALNIA